MPRHERRAQLLDVAVEVFACRGFSGTSMDDVAAAAGVTKPVLYQHFTSKSDLYGAIVRGVGSEIGGIVRDAHDDPELGEDPIDRACTALVATMLRLKGRARMLVPAEGFDDDVAEVVTEQRRFVVDGLTEAITRTKAVSQEEAAAVSFGVFAMTLAAGAEPEWRARSEQKTVDLTERKAALLDPVLRSLLTALEDR